MMKLLTNLCLLFLTFSCAATLQSIDDNRALTQRGESGVQNYQRTKNSRDYRIFKENEEEERKRKANLTFE